MPVLAPIPSVEISDPLSRNFLRTLAELDRKSGFHQTGASARFDAFLHEQGRLSVRAAGYDYPFEVAPNFDSFFASLERMFFHWEPAMQNRLKQNLGDIYRAARAFEDIPPFARQAQHFLLRAHALTAQTARVLACLETLTHLRDELFKNPTPRLAELFVEHAHCLISPSCRGESSLLPHLSGSPAERAEALCDLERMLVELSTLALLAHVDEEA